MGKGAEASVYERRAEVYRSKLESEWWDERVGRYHTWYSNDGKFGMGEGETFLLWFDALQDTARKRKTLEHLMSRDWNVENMSYFPCIFYREGYWDDGRRYILYLSDPKTPRREYPEVSFGVVQGVVLGLMGVSVLPGTRTVCSLYQSNHPGSAWLDDLPVLGTVVGLRHDGPHSSTFTNRGSRVVKWRASFSGAYTWVSVNGHSLRLKQERTMWGRIISSVDVPVNPGTAVSVKVK